MQRELESAFQTRVIVDNDVNFAALSERRWGCAQGIATLAYLFVGRGIGAGLIVNGRLFRGSTDAAGEVGQMVIDRPNLYQRFAPEGCLESLAGIDRLADVAQSLGLTPPTAETLCEHAFAGDARALDAIQQIDEYLAAAIINMAAVLDPDMIVLGGELAEFPHAQELFVRPIERLARPHMVATCRVSLSVLPGRGVLRGAVQAALDWTLEEAEVLPLTDR